MRTRARNGRVNGANGGGVRGAGFAAVGTKGAVRDGAEIYFLRLDKKTDPRHIMCRGLLDVHFFQDPARAFAGSSQSAQTSPK